MEKINILQITQSLGGGVQKYVIQLCEHLDPNRFRITGCCSIRPEGDNREEGDIPFSEAFRQIGVPYFVVPMQRSINPLKDFLSFLLLYKSIKQKNFDIVHAHSSKAGVLARIAARMAGVPVVIYSPHAFSFDGPRHILKKIPYILFEKIAAFFCDSIITDSPTEKELALKFKIAREEKISVIPTSIKLKEYNPEINEQERKKYLKILGIPKEHKIVTMIGRLSPQKDPITFILSSQRLKKKYQKVTFLLVGDGPLREECCRLLQEVELNGQMKVLGWRRDYKELLKISDILVSYSLWEGLPFILLEAMAFSKPVVATRSTGIVDVINDGENGFLVPPRSPEILSDKIKWVLDRPEVAAKVGKAAKKIVEERFNLGKTIPRIEELYIQLYKNKIKNA
jgi:glycosyltransferase involved in cell wall biosynthesis